MIKRFLITFVLLNSFFVVPLLAQAFQGYTLYGPNNGKNTYLIDMNKNVIKTWTHSKSGGYSAYLLTDGSVLRTAASSSSSLNGGGAQGVVQKYNWAGTITWEYTYSTTTVRSHHDIEPMPNGNVLIVAWESKTAAQGVAAGLNHSGILWPDHIVEVQPSGSTGGNIVWQWHAWDHLVQDYDASKANYGVVADHPELLNVNCGSSATGDWMHVNGISYDPVNDLIVFSSHTLDEVYVIDHSTTTAEAASHAGGARGKGGDFLYRWGKSSNYNIAGTQVFDVVHCAIFIPQGCPGAGNIMAFNNRETQSTSIVQEIVPPRDANGNFLRTTGQAFGPAAAKWSYTASGFFSNHLGSCQRLPNGNTLMVESTSGYFTECDSLGNVVWYWNKGGEIVRALRYAPTYSGLSALVDVEEKLPDNSENYILYQSYPNPLVQANGSAQISYTINKPGYVTLKVYDISGKEVANLAEGNHSIGKYTVNFNAKNIASGVYIYELRATDGVKRSKLVVTK